MFTIKSIAMVMATIAMLVLPYAHAAESLEQAHTENTPKNEARSLDKKSTTLLQDANKDAAQEKNIEDLAPMQTKVYEVFIKDHSFSPNVIKAPSNTEIKLIVHNQDASPEEFESDDLRFERIIKGNSKAIITLKPLGPGKYHFYGEFNEDKANGYLIVE